MAFQTQFLAWTVNMSVSAKSILVMVTNHYSYALMGAFIFTVPLDLYVQSEMVPCQMPAIGPFLNQHSKSATCQYTEPFHNEPCLWPWVGLLHPPPNVNLKWKKNLYCKISVWHQCSFIWSGSEVFKMYSGEEISAIFDQIYIF